MIHFFDLLDAPDGDILAWLEPAYGEDIINLKTVQSWTLKYRNGEIYPDKGPGSR
jgi:hypothetical protein